MSMLSDQCDRLRELARRMDGLAPGNAALLREAADTIWELRNKLNDADDENERLRRKLVSETYVSGELSSCLYDIDWFLDHVTDCDCKGWLHAIEGYRERMRGLGVSKWDATSE